MLIFLSFCQKEKYFLGKTNVEFTGNQNKPKIFNQETEIINKEIEENKDKNINIAKILENTNLKEENIGGNNEIKQSHPEGNEINNTVAINKDSSKDNKVLFILDDKFFSINQNIINSCLITLKEFKSKLQLEFISFEDFNKKDAESLKKFNLIIGPLNEADDEIYKKISTIKAKYISLNKKTHHSNKIYFRPTSNQKFDSLLSFLQNNKRTDIAFLLPSNKKSNNIYEGILKSKLPRELNIINVEFYNENNKNSIKKSLDNIQNNLTHTALFDSNNKQIKINFKDLNKQDKQELIKNNNEFFNNKKLTQIQKKTDTVFILANDSDWEYILSMLNKNDFFKKNIFYITETRSIKNISNKEHFKNDFFFTWGNPYLKEEFDEKYFTAFNVKANDVSYLIYDLLASIINWIEFDKKNDQFFINSNIFYGIYGDFQFNKNLSRRFGVYAVDDNLDFYLQYKPELFFT